MSTYSLSEVKYTKASCRRCRPVNKVRGKILVSFDHPEVSLAGSDAHRLFFRCENGHVRPIGYTKPVDFSKNPVLLDE